MGKLGIKDKERKHQKFWELMREHPEKSIRQLREESGLIPSPETETFPLVLEPEIINYVDLFQGHLKFFRVIKVKEEKLLRFGEISAFSILVQNKNFDFEEEFVFHDNINDRKDLEKFALIVKKAFQDFLLERRKEKNGK